jgi:hypothetical protein
MRSPIGGNQEAANGLVAVSLLYRHIAPIRCHTGTVESQVGRPIADTLSAAAAEFRNGCRRIRTPAALVLVAPHPDEASRYVINDPGLQHGADGPFSSGKPTWQVVKGFPDRQIWLCGTGQTSLREFRSEHTKVRPGEQDFSDSGEPFRRYFVSAGGGHLAAGVRGIVVVVGAVGKPPVAQPPVAQPRAWLQQLLGRAQCSGGHAAV